VEAIEVNTNEGTLIVHTFSRLCPFTAITMSINHSTFTGGVTKYRGGCRICIIPAGYVGCAFWAGLFVSMSGSRIGGTIVAAGMSAALLVSLW
jgi:Peptidase M50B-like